MLAQEIDFSFGARAGVLLNLRNADRVLVTNTIGVLRSDSQRYVVGPTFEMGFKRRFAIEFSPTYRREGTTGYNDVSSVSIPPLLPGSLALLSQFTRVSDRVWDLPLVGKYYFTKKEAKIRPFFGFGASAFRHSRSNEVFSQFQTDNAGGRRAQTYTFPSADWGLGPVVTGGLSVHSGRFSVVPEFRYVRDSRISLSGDKNRAEVFLGFRF